MLMYHLFIIMKQQLLKNNLLRCVVQWFMHGIFFCTVQYGHQLAKTRFNSYKNYILFIMLLPVQCSWFSNQSLNNGNRTKWTPIQSVIIRVINKIGWPHSGNLICLITSMITDRIGWQEVLLPINHNYNKIWALWVLSAICHEMISRCLKFRLFKFSLLLALILATQDIVKTFFSLLYTLF